MKKKGFTLVELLAVTVILAVIALIATPTILGVIEKAKKEAAEQSAYGYIDAIEKQILINETSNSKEQIKDGIYNVSDLEVSYKGEKIKYGQVTIEKGKATKTKLCINKYSIDYEESKIKISSNNYCSNEYKIELIIEENKQSKNIGKENSTIFELTDISSMTNVSCNNGAIPTIENNTLIINNIYGDTTCKINDNLEETINQLDNTETNIIMLNDEEVFDTLTIKNDSNIVLNLNQATITSNSNPLFYVNKNDNIIINSNENGKIISNNCHIFRMSLSNSKLTINNGTYQLSENASSTCQIIYIASDNNYVIINDGLFKTENHDNILSNGNSNLLINGGMFLSNKRNLLMYDGNTIITKGYFNSSYDIEESSLAALSLGGKANLKLVGDTSKTCTDTPSNDGICIYSKVNSIRNGGSGDIEINGGTIISENKYTISTISDGNIYINKGLFITKATENVYGTIYISGTGNINICGGEIISSVKDIYSNGEGTINYSTNVIFTDGTNTPYVNGDADLSKIVNNYEGSCISK